MTVELVDVIRLNGLKTPVALKLLRRVRHTSSKHLRYLNVPNASRRNLRSNFTVSVSLQHHNNVTCCTVHRRFRVL